MQVSYSQIKNNGINFLENMRVGSGWSFRFSGDNRPNLIASALAVMLGALLGWLDKLSNEEKKSWADYLNSFQRKDGFFEDEDISEHNLAPGYTKERALFHRTRHTLFALVTLGHKPKYDFRFLEDKFEPITIEKWTKGLNLSDFWDAGNKIMDLALFLSYEAKVNRNKKAESTVYLLMDLCDANVNPETGYHDAGKSELRNAMAGAMHLYPIYFLWERKPKYPENIIRTTLSLQQSDAFFSYEVGSCGEDCLDYDAVSILVNFYFIAGSYQQETERTLERLLTVIEKCQNSDGGFCCHRRRENYRFGTFSTEVPIEGSSLWSTYSRILTIALATKVIKGHSAAGDWNLGNNIMETWDGGTGQMKVRV